MKVFVRSAYQNPYHLPAKAATSFGTSAAGTPMTRSGGMGIYSGRPSAAPETAGGVSALDAVAPSARSMTRTTRDSEIIAHPNLDRAVWSTGIARQQSTAVLARIVGHYA